jgi:peptidoglycan hydrolase-like protein with peptidoglycan-binding domain
MRKRLWFCYLGAVLLVSAVPVVLNAASAAAAQSSAKKKKAAASKKNTKSKPIASKPTAHPQMAPTPDRIREIQSALNREGALEAEPNGRWDNEAIEAMKKYQGSHGLNPSGKIDALTLQKLGLGSEIAGKAAPAPLAPSANPPSNPAR